MRGRQKGPQNGGHNVISYHIISHHIVDFKRQNRLKVGTTNKPKLKVKMQSVSDDDVRKRLLEKGDIRHVMTFGAAKLQSITHYATP